MAPTVQVSPQELEGYAARFGVIRGELERAQVVFDDRGAFASPVIDRALEEFCRRWTKRRAELVGDLEEAERFIAESVAEFRRWDEGQRDRLPGAPQVRPPGVRAAPTAPRTIANPPTGGLEGYLAAAGLRPSSEKWAQGRPANGRADRWNKAAMNCTSWAAHRRVQLGKGVPPRGHGGELGTDPNLLPTLGAMVSWREGAYGHVMIVEEVRGPDEFRVSEMNWDNEGGHLETRVWRRIPNTNQWTSDDPSRSSTTLYFTP